MARPPPGTGQPPVSFKTVPGRHRTQKWQVAKQYDYSGDDWGGYDAYDDYGDQYNQPAPAPAPAPQSAQAAYPSQQGRQQRQQSFDDGDERRVFTGPGAFPQAAPSPASGGGRGSSDYPSRPRDFTNPEQVPPPLNTLRGSQPPTPAPPGAFPPRKSSSSISRGSPAPDAAEKELPTIPFIRPSDIYKRMEAAKEQERKSSLDSTSRASMDSASGPSVEEQQGGRPLSKVMEGGDTDDTGMVSTNRQGPLLDLPQEYGEPSRSGSETGQTPATRAPLGTDPAAEILAERTTPTATRAPPGTDPAADILAERSYVAPTSTTPTTSFNSMQTSPPAPTRAPPGTDPAADILAERTHSTPISSLGSASATRAPQGFDPAAEILAERTPSNLAHQPSQASQASQGYRSMVNRAFDATDDASVPATPIERDNSTSLERQRLDVDVSRSNTTSTSSISPIMSRVPSAATAEMRLGQQQQPEQQVPTIAEEPHSDSAPRVIARKPSPSGTGGRGSANSSSPAAVIEKGYRRSLDPPSSDNSPAHTPDVQDSRDRSLSGGYAAETFTAPSTEEERVGRPRAGTDYSVRESDLPHTGVVGSNEFSPEAAEQQRREQDEFLRMHAPPFSAEGVATRAPPGADPAGDILAERMGMQGATRAPPGADPAGDILNERTSGQAATRAAPGTDPAGDILAERTQGDVATRAPRGADPAGDILAERMGAQAATRAPLGADPAGEILAERTGTQAATRAPLGADPAGEILAERTYAGSARSSSPAKSRVRDLAGKYEEIDASRRNSQALSAKSSWSNFRGSEENLPGKLVKRQETGQSNVVSESDYGGVEEGGIRDSMVDPDDDGGVVESPAQEVERPTMGMRDQSFRPHLPGEWVSFSGATPGVGPAPVFAPTASFPEEEDDGRVATRAPPGSDPAADILAERTYGTPQHTPRASRQVEDDGPVDFTPNPRKVSTRAPPGTDPAADILAERTYTETQHTPRASRQVEEDEGPVDLSPTTRKVPLESSHSSPSPSSDTLFGHAKNAGDALGAALLSSVGMGHQTRDFGSAAPAPEVEQPSERRNLGDLGYLRSPERPWLNRGDTDESVASTVSATTAGSSSVPPTPPAKDTPQPSLGAGGSSYVSPAIAPLRTGYSRDPTPEFASKPGSSVLSTIYGEEGLQRDDSLRREIVRSLDSASIQRQQERENAARTQDALDAPENLVRVSQGENALPATEISDDSPSKPEPLRPILDQRFSWEKREEGKGLLDSTPTKPEIHTGNERGLLDSTPTKPEIHTGNEKPLPRIRTPEPDHHPPEILPEMPYERPRSRGLRITNASDNEQSDDKDRKPTTPEAAERGLEQGLPIGAIAAVGAGVGVGAGTNSAGLLGTWGPVSPITKSQENLHARHQDAARDSGDASDMRELEPSPVSEGASRWLPSYYTQDGPSLELAGQRSHDRDSAGTNAAPEAVGDSSPETTVPPPPPEKEARTSMSTVSPTSPTSGKQKIPPFREILAIKNSETRIKTYDETRRTFADMDTGLSNWLSNMLAQNPEYASLSTEPSSRPTPASIGRGHRPSPSLAKFAVKGFGGDPQRSNTVSGTSGGGEGVGSVDMDKLQQRGKDLMKGASVLGGKAGAGAKGLFAKGRSRFGTQRESKGGGKDLDFSSSSRSPSATPTPPSLSLTPIHPLSSAANLGLNATTITVFTATLPSHTTNSRSPSPALAQPPPPRSQTHTPSSVSSAAGPLSRTLSRLREGSRSFSRSRNSSRSWSRPSSLVLTATVTNNTNSELQTVEDASPLGGGTGAEARAVISPWSEPGEAAFFGVEEERSGTPARLGVLPSPGAETFDGFVGSSPGTAGGAGEPKMEESAGNETVTDRFTAAETTTGNAANGTTSKDEEDAVKDDHFDNNATAEDMATRDMQQPSTPYIPIPAGPERGEDEDDDDLYDTTPKKVSPTSVRKEKNDEEPDESTPVVAKDAQESEAVQESSGDFQVWQYLEAEQSAAGADEGEETGVGMGENDSESPASAAPRAVGVPEQDSSTANRAQPESTSPVQPQDGLLKPASPDESGAQEGSERSGISSHQEFEGTEEEPAADGSPSRRSSVSSIGHDDPDKPVMSAQAVPAGPFVESEDYGAVQEQRSLNRPYQFDSGEGRTRSYVELDRDSTGAPVQESLDSASRLGNELVGLSGLSGPPHDIPPFQQRRVPRESTGDVKPKRYSGMVKGRRPTLTSPEPDSTQPPATNADTDHPGPGGLQDGAPAAIRREIQNRAPQKHDDPQDKQSKRRSGLWDAFKRSPSVSKTDISKDDSSQRADSEQNGSVPRATQASMQTQEQTVRATTTRTPQRASTTTKEPEQKKKRFSGLGSLFGRSSTTGHRTEKPKKLSKAQSPGREGSQIRDPAVSTSYDEYEATRQQRIPNFSQRQPQTYPPPSVGPPPQQYLEPAARVIASPENVRMAPPPGGWYAPRGDEPRSLPWDEHQPPPQNRRLHSDAGRRDSPLTNVPEAFRPVDSSFIRPIVPAGPYSEDSMAGRYAPPTSPISPSTQPPRAFYPPQPVDAYSPTYAIPQQRHPSYGSSESQVSGQSEWQRSDWRHRGSSASASISPIQTRNGYEDYPTGRILRIGSITEEIARSPARDYPDQQTPWSINLPQGGRGSRSSSLGMQDFGRQPQPESIPSGRQDGRYQQSGMYQMQRGLPMSSETPGSFYTATQPRQLPPPMAYAPTYDDRPARNMVPSRSGSLPSQPYSGQSPQPSPYSNRPYRRKGWPPRGKFYAEPEYNQELPHIPRVTNSDPQRQFNDDYQMQSTQHRSSGYVVHRDETAPREEGPEMRGVSYPGQEWVPEPWE